ncbi:hypothetical protein [Candidatus Ichthyocystis hellenicum]|uniref:hypothetical protein n=1 Tax=Candidatus Ichthyocystis hellenicum TaxID=1561003 RepID=UPI000B885E0B|nr:hypothetical protein [Candidatus Ichthyocystis hellenicum]
MCYTNSKYLDFSQNSSLEFQPNSEVVEESECTTVMVSEHETQKDYRSTFDKELNEVSIVSNGTPTESPHHWDIPLRSNNADSQYSDDYTGSVELLEELKDAYDYVMEEKETFGIIGRPGGFCDDSSTNICGVDNKVNTTISSECCPNIHSYIEDLFPTPTSSTTTEPKVISSTTVSTTVASGIMNSTTVPTTMVSEIVNSTATSTSFIPTEIIPIGKDLTVTIAVLVAFLSLAIAALSFVGYKCCLNKRIQQRDMSQGYDINEEEEDLV